MPTFYFLKKKNRAPASSAPRARTQRSAAAAVPPSAAPRPPPLRPALAPPLRPALAPVPPPLPLTARPPARFDPAASIRPLRSGRSGPSRFGRPPARPLRSGRSGSPAAPRPRGSAPCGCRIYRASGENPSVTVRFEVKGPQESRRQGKGPNLPSLMALPLPDNQAR
ncbi:uncharacterized protein LOC110430739 isoform X1 [Sorghum bicolor]|uniref:uncharacterized protein LOC110430739 isoform X1 n=1 Tax=Sorghum bicolor TaxID=4558 RepID=UPI000B424E9B|nr:uncharacterized protein LOC110430739 isoform X1 [Sorghum bicolor]|eukprot:XP_021304300.1 uncharacterized protein LOC110430739 isoform X1 [Sorghum bicolor]